MTREEFIKTAEENLNTEHTSSEWAKIYKQTADTGIEFMRLEEALEEAIAEKHGEQMVSAVTKRAIELFEVNEGYSATENRFSSPEEEKAYENIFDI